MFVGCRTARGLNESPLEHPAGLGPLTQPVENPAQAIEITSIERIDRHRAFDQSSGLFKPAPLHSHEIAEIVEGGRLYRIHAEYLAKDGNGFGRPALAMKD